MLMPDALGRGLVVADRVDVPPEGGLAVEEGENEHHHELQDDHHREPDGADDALGEGGQLAHVIDLGAGDDEPQPARDAHGGQRDDEGDDPKFADQQAVEGAEHSAVHSPTSQTARIAQPLPASPLSRNFSTPARR